MATAKAAMMPSMIYGTAWKKSRTRGLVKDAILAGFRGIDTAAQPKHYQEDLVGHGIRDAMLEGDIRRDQLYIQTKFTPIAGQDPQVLPYDPWESISHQIKTSVAGSLFNLATPADGQVYLDCLVLHSPFPSVAETQEAWRAMEAHTPHEVRSLGISNIYSLDALQQLYENAAVKPSVVQNRFYSATRWDSDIRAFCKKNDMIYQSFWTLTGNPELLQSEAVARVAEKAGVSKPVALYSLVLGLGNTAILNGTTNETHMREDLLGVTKMREWSDANYELWAEALLAFRSLTQC